MQRTLPSAVRLLLVVALVGVTLPALATRADASPRSTREARVEQLLTELHAYARRDPGAWPPATGSRVPGLAPWSDLRDHARTWSDHQAAGRCSGGATICHNTGAPDGPGLANVVSSWSGLGENVAWRSLTTSRSTLSDSTLDDMARQLMAGWMASPGHRRNILGTGWDDFGTSATYRRTSLGDGRYRHELFATAIFRTRRGTPPGGPYGHPTVTPRSIDAACAARATVTFRDVARDSALGRAAGCLATWEVAAGRTDGTYGPGAQVTRGQMASFLDKALAAAGRRPPAPTRTRFPDAAGTTHAAAIERLAAAGIVSGRPDGTYGPAAPVTRAQMATFLRRSYEHASGRTMPSPGTPFYDSIGSAHAPAIGAVAHAGFAAGTGPGTYGPNRLVTRGQMAHFLARWLDLAVSEGLTTGPR